MWRLGSKLADDGKMTQAVDAYYEGARLGDPSAQSNLANILDDQLGRSTEAVYWYKRAIDAGHSVAALNLAIHYKNLGKRRWYIHWLHVAARMGEDEAERELEAAGASDCGFR